MAGGINQGVIKYIPILHSQREGVDVRSPDEHAKHHAADEGEKGSGGYHVYNLLFLIEFDVVPALSIKQSLRQICVFH